MNYSEIISKVAKELNLSERIVDKTYKSYWLSIRNAIQNLPLKEDLSEEEFAKLKTNFNIPSLGKLNCTYDRYIGVKKRLALIKEIKKNVENKENQTNG